MIARADLEKYGVACKKLENFISLPMGGIQNRPGTEYIGAAKNGNKKARLIRFSFSTSTNFLIELGEDYARFWSNGAQVTSGGSPLEVVLPYQEADLDEVQFLQVKDVVYLTHKSYTPYKLTRIADDNWTAEAVAFDRWPYQDENVTKSATVLPSATSGSIIVTASEDTFESGYVNGRMRVSHRRDESTAEVSKVISATGTSSALIGRGAFTFKTTGTWKATIEIEQSLDNGTSWESIRQFKAESDRNFEITFYIDKTSQVRINITAWTSGSSNQRAILECQDQYIHGVAKIDTVVATEASPTAWADVTAYVVGNQVTENAKKWVCIQAHTSSAANDQPDSGTNYTDYWQELTSANYATATVETTLARVEATDYWSAPAWCTATGFPRTVTLHDSRIVYGGTEEQPLTFWGTVTNDFENFITGINDDDSVNFTISSPADNVIRWMTSSQGKLFVGTSGGEFIVSSGQDSPAITPSAVQVTPHTNYGSDPVQAILLNDSLMFIQRIGRIIRDLTYDFGKDGYTGMDVSILAEHLTYERITQTAFSQSPWATLWAISGTNLISLTYEREQNVIGWHKHTTDGTFESVASIPGDPNDEVWVIVKRNVNGVDVRYVERFEPNTLDKAYQSLPEDCLYLDAGQLINLGAPGTTVTGLSHLEGETVGVLIDGATHPEATVSSGQITLQTAATKVSVGLRYTPVGETMPLVAQGEQGATYTRLGRVSRLALVLDRTLGLEHSPHGAAAADDLWDRIFFRDAGDAMDSAPPLFTGIRDVTFASKIDRELTVSFRQPDPLPCTILALVTEWEVTEDS